MLGATVSAKELPLQSSDPLGIFKSKDKKKTSKHKKYTVKQGDTLISIADKYKTSAKRLFYKNKNIENPDSITPSQKLLIPNKDEKLKPRNYPAMASSQTIVPKSSNSGKLTGSIGYARCGGNCVLEPGVNSPHLGVGTGPSDWPSLFSTPRIGATVLFNFNHTGVVTGIWSDGSIEVRHQNYCYNKHRFYPNEIRGYR